MIYMKNDFYIYEIKYIYVTIVIFSLCNCMNIYHIMLFFIYEIYPIT